MSTKTRPTVRATFKAGPHENAKVPTSPMVGAGSLIARHRNEAGKLEMGEAAPADRCTYAAAGTYGHECGRPALFVGIRASEHTASGIYYARRCAECRDATGRENWGVRDWAPFDPARHVNTWR